MPTQNNEVFLKEREAAEVTRLSVHTLRRRRFEGREPAYVKIGASVRYALGDLQDFMAKHRIDPEE